MKRGRIAGIISVLFLGVMLIPLQLFASPLVRIDMDANTAGYQDTILVNAGESFTSNVELVLSGGSDSLSSFGFSLWWDVNRLNAPQSGNITTFTLAEGWSDLGYWKIQSPYIYNFSQINNNSYSQGPMTSVIASVTWTASSGGLAAIMPGNYSAFDGAYDGNYTATPVSFAGGAVNIAPEPVSTLLFLSGGAALAGRRYVREKRAAKP